MFVSGLTKKPDLLCHDHGRLEEGATAKQRTSSPAGINSRPNEFDVFFGRNPTAVRSAGNKRLRALVNQLFPQYEQYRARENCTTEKTVMISTVYDFVRTKGGRFLKMNKSGQWIEATKKESRAKISHLFRDSIPRSTTPDRAPRRPAPDDSFAPLLIVPKIYGAVEQDTSTEHGKPSCSGRRARASVGTMKAEDVLDERTHQEGTTLVQQLLPVDVGDAVGMVAVQHVEEPKMASVNRMHSGGSASPSASSSSSSLREESIGVVANKKEVEGNVDPISGAALVRLDDNDPISPSLLDGFSLDLESLMMTDDNHDQAFFGTSQQQNLDHDEKSPTTTDLDSEEEPLEAFLFRTNQQQNLDDSDA